jgi:hypothetical protein
MFRLFIDIPLAMTEEEAAKVSQKIMSLINVQHILDDCGIEQLNYRLGHDEDRQKSNYLIKTENGHVTNKKCRINLTSNTEVL